MLPVDGDGNRTAAEVTTPTVVSAATGPVKGIVFRFRINIIGADGTPTAVTTDHSPGTTGVENIGLAVEEYGNDVVSVDGDDLSDSSQR